MTSTPAHAPQTGAGPDLDTAIARACRRIAPLWPLDRFVAVNPFMGLTERPFHRAAAQVRAVRGGRALAPPDRIRAMLADGRITERDIAEALAGARGEPGVPPSVGAFRDALAKTHATGPAATAATMAGVIDRVRDAGAASLIRDQLAGWCAAYWDGGQAAWRMPGRRRAPYAAWRTTGLLDRTPDVAGWPGARDAMRALPEDPRETIRAVVAAFALPAEAVEPYLHAALASVGGWAAYARYCGWFAELRGEDDDTLVDLLAIRLAWDYGLYHALRRTSADVDPAWRERARGMAALADGPEPTEGEAVAWVGQLARERAIQRQLAGVLVPPPREQPTRPAAHAAFCIDVRSEIFRRALERAAPEVVTCGVAGFFGVPFTYRRFGDKQGTPHAPALIEPGHTVPETVGGAGPDEVAGALHLRALRRRAHKCWKAFKSSAVSSFVYVESAGLGFAAKLAGDALGWTRPVVHPRRLGLDRATRERLRPDPGPRVDGGERTGFGETEQVDLAEGALRAAGIPATPARLVLLIGHESTSVNNPHASGLDCGACGGQSGEANARVAADLLNDPAVRAGLAERGWWLPEDTVFVAGVHDTTTDTVTLPDRERVPESHTPDLRWLAARLGEAGAQARRERAPALGVSPDAADRELPRRARDWAQVRPEWGLAGNAVFIAAPRTVTRHLDLGGRAFLHTYDWHSDSDTAVLTQIITAPLVVATWINMQYHASTVDPARFGSGNKTLHNVVGALGVLEGNRGDLRVGLPWQSVHDGTAPRHEPVRLTAVIAAPAEAIDRVLDTAPAVRALADNTWLHLLALDPDSGELRRRAGAGDWRVVHGEARASAAPLGAVAA